MSMSKTKNILLETTATYQPLSDLNVRFWSQDKNTAELRFIITRNQFPLSLSKENVKVIIALESGSSFISSDDFIIDSEVEGVARYIIPSDFMRVASNVTGQVYVTTLDKEEIIVERQFKFTVSNDLLNDYPSEDKLRYIKTFDDLRNEIASRVSKLESDMETMEDYVVQVQDTTQKGITALTNLIKQKQDAYNANHTAKMKELNDKGSEYSAKFDDDKVYMDDKFQAFQESVNGSGLVTTGQSKNWQKYKLTDDDGTSVSLASSVDLGDPVYLSSLTPGEYYAPGSKSSPNGASGFLTVLQRGTIKVIYFQPYNQDRLFINRYYNEWSGWFELTNQVDDTGWIPFNIINCGRTNTAYDYGKARNGYGCSYRAIKIGSMTQKFIRVNADNVSHGQVIAQLPANFAKSPQVGFIRAPLDHNGTSIIIENNGEVKVYIANYPEWSVSNDKYIYGTISWVE